MTAGASKHPAAVAFAQLVASSGASDIDVEILFAPHVVQGTGAAGLSQLVASLAGLEISAVEELSATAVMVDLRGEGARQHVVCAVEPTPPHRVTLLDRQRPDWPVDGAEQPSVAWGALIDGAPLDRWTALPAEFSAVIDDRLVAARVALRTPAIAAAVVLDQELAYSAAVGYADVFPITPADRGCGLRVGSITKTMTAIAVMGLVEQEHLILDAPANSYLTGTQITCEIADAPPVTVRHLLTHTAGLPRNRRGFDIAIPSNQPLPALRDSYSGDLATTRPPGEREYSNDGYGLLALIIEDVTGERFEDYLIDNVFVPLGMSNTACDNAPKTTSLYRGLDVRCGVVAASPSTRDATRGGGSVVTTIDDLARYELALMDSSSAGALTRRTRSQLLARDSPLRVFETRVAHGEEINYFTGGMYGAQADIRFVPRLGVGVALFANVYNRYESLRFAKTSEQLLAALLPSAPNVSSRTATA